VGLTASFSVAALLFPALCSAAAAIPGEEQVGILYGITHLHWAAYLILFIIFVLSVLNLIYQARTPVPETAGQGHSHGEGHTAERGNHSPAGRPFVSPRAGRSGDERIVGSGSRPEIQAPPENGSVGQARVVRRTSPGASSQPTPLDGVNHPLPLLEAKGDNGSATPKRAERQPQSRPFRFRSAVDLPSPEELERREREKLVVSGTVKGVDGKGIASVLVYLADERGNRLGQSCRSLPDTGEFKVQVNEPGRYLLHAYKRGLAMENPVPSVLPLESGKIEGFDLKMIPEGCLVQGKVVVEAGLELGEKSEVTCVRRGGDFSRSEPLGPEGEFRFFGVPLDSEYLLEVRGADGTLLAASDPIETSRRREITCDIRVPSHRTEETDQAVGLEEQPWSDDEEADSALKDPPPSDHAS
jgi:hypothetical protein